MCCDADEERAPAPGREWQLVAGVKRLVSDMREQVKGVVSHREKCCMVLSAAMAASVALDQVRGMPAPPPPLRQRSLLLHAR